MTFTRRHLRLGMVLGAALVVLWLLWLARGALLPFLVGALLAYLLTPLVTALSSVLRSRRLSEENARSLAIAVIYASGLGLLALLGFLYLPPIIEGARDLAGQRAELIAQAREQVEGALALYRQNVPGGIQEQIANALDGIGAQLSGVLVTALQQAVGAVTQTFSVLLGFLVVPFWLIYVLKDQHKAIAAVQRAFPPSLRPDVEAITRIAGKALGNYCRGQIILGLFVGVLAGVGLWLLGIPFALPLAVIAGITELIPVLGPVLGAIAAIVVTLAVDPGLKVVWVLLLFVAIQQVENYVLVPRVQGKAMRMHPALVIVLVIVAGQLYGLWGMIVAVPVAAVLRDSFIYIYRRLDSQGGSPAAASDNYVAASQGAPAPHAQPNANEEPR